MEGKKNAKVIIKRTQEFNKVPLKVHIHGKNDKRFHLENWKNSNTVGKLGGHKTTQNAICCNTSNFSHSQACLFHVLLVLVLLTLYMCSYAVKS